MARGSTTGPATPAKSGGARDESPSPDVTAARLAAVSELSVSFEAEVDNDPAARDDYDKGDEVTSRNLAAELDDVAGPDPDYDDFNDGTEGSKPSVASAKHSAALNAPCPPINGDTPATKRVFDRVQALVKSDEWMQLFKPIPKQKADWPALANELQYPVNSVSTNQVKSQRTRKSHGNPGRRPVQDSASANTQDARTYPPTKHGADRGTFGAAEASLYFQDSHMVTPRSASPPTDASSSGGDDLLPLAYEDEDPQAELTPQMREIAALNDSDPTPRIEMASHRPLDHIEPFSGYRNESKNSMQWLRTFVYEMTGTHTEADK
ncbi:hypothetical protein GQ600_13237 [Phytophthora cactorum]|nr:hypothetical protein GQ600_13237 [Phytophthora cactorum]